MSELLPKDFDEWNERKKSLHSAAKEILFHEREVWWCSLGLNIGSEQDGVNELFERPVLVVRKFNKKTLWVLPFTRTDKVGPFYKPVTVGDFDSTLILSQLRLISANRLQRYMCNLPKGQFREAVAAVQRLFPRV